MEGEQQVMLRRDGGRQTDLDLVAPCGVRVVMQDRATVLSFHSYSAVYRLLIKDKYAVEQYIPFPVTSIVITIRISLAQTEV